MDWRTKFIDEGADAFWRGVRISENPYEKKTSLSTLWLKGYLREVVAYIKGEI